MSTIDGARRADTINAEPRRRRPVADPLRAASPPPPFPRDGRVWDSDLGADKSGRFDLIFAEKLRGLLGEVFRRGRTVHLSRQDGLGRLGHGLGYFVLSRSRGEADAGRQLLTGLEQRRLTAVRLQRVDPRAGCGCADRNELLSHFASSTASSGFLVVADTSYENATPPTAYGWPPAPDGYSHVATLSVKSLIGAAPSGPQS